MIRSRPLIALALVFAAQPPVTAQDVPAQSDTAKRGEVQFSKSCAFCHGSDATGTSEGPDLLRSTLVRHDESGNLIGPVIRDGRPGKGMPPIRLNQTQIADVAAFLDWRLADAGRASPAEAHDLSLEQLLTGNAAAGKAFFNGPGNCSRCHSPSRDLAGIAKKYSPADLQARFLYPSDVPKTATITTPEGKQVTGELVYQDAFSIAVKDHDGWYHSWPCWKVKFQIHDPLTAHLDLLPKYKQADVHNLFAYLETLK
ncbi:MAG TPA: c-type cytochrome [Bryobacteraceae bacterium]